MKRKEIEVGDNLGCVLMVIVICITIIILFL